LNSKATVIICAVPSVITVSIISLLSLGVPIGNFVTASQSFPLQGIKDKNIDWTLVELPLEAFNNAKNLSECVIGEQSRYPTADIAAMGYQSDGEIINTRLWLSAPFDVPDSLTSEFRHIEQSYSLLVDIESEYDIGQVYRFIIDCNPMAKVCEKVLREEPPPFMRSEPVIISAVNNYTELYDENKGYVDLSFNLSDINYPEQFSLIAYVSDTYLVDSVLCHLVDITDVVHIPPPELSLSLSPTTVSLRPGEVRTIELKMANNNTKLNPHVLLSSKEINGLNITILPHNLSIPPEGMSSSIMKIEADEMTPARPYTATVTANISFPTIIRNYLTEQTLLNPTSAHIIKSFDISFTVLEPLSFQEHMSSFLENWFSPLTGAYATIVTIISGILGWRIWTKNRKSASQEAAG